MSYSINSNGLAATAACSILLSMAGGTMAPAYASSTQYDLIPREALLGNPTQSQGRISPDGKWLSWLAPKDGVMNVWVAPADAPDEARVITKDKLRGVNAHFWTPDSAYILTQQDKGGDENFHLYATNIETAETRDLTPIKDGARAQMLQMNKDYPGRAIIGINERDPQFFDLYELDYRTGEMSLLAENPGYGGWEIDNSLTPRFAVETIPGGGANIYHVNAKGEKGELFQSIENDDFFNTSLIGFTKDNKSVYMLDSRGRDKAAYTKVEIETGKVTEIASSDLADISNIAADPVTLEPLAYAVNHLKTEWTALDPSVEDDLAYLKSQFKGQISITSATRDNRKWVVVDDAAEAPGTFQLYDRDSKTLTELFSSRPALADAPLQPMHPVAIKARDGLELVSYYTLPPGSDEDGDGIPDKPVPTLLWVHGGPWARDGYGYNATHQWMANRGYAVLSVNYRGSTGFGKNHVNKAIGEWSGKMHDDLIDAVDWAIEQGIADPDKVAIGGGSYGGYATLVGVTFTPDKFACGVDIVGPSNLVTLMESFPPYWRPVLEGTFYRHIGDPAKPEDRERIVAQSPLTHVDNIKVPLLIGQGANDPRVTKIEADQIADAMKEKNLPVTYLSYTDEGHGFQRPENRLSFFAAMEGFLAECLGGRAEPIGDAFKGSSAEILAGIDGVKGLAEASKALAPGQKAD
ncbi:S9 family peptidase [Maritalea sp. S77]|uniref:S9 family peptidase n=1 Tax=Maritalea sp. S77 TaxID=3415125 RepID=UPI003C7C53F1